MLWLVLAARLVRKPGAGTLTGILKGFVELLTGNTHSLLVVMVDIVAGLLVDLGMAHFRYRQKLPPYLIVAQRLAARWRSQSPGSRADEPQSVPADAGAWIVNGHSAHHLFARGAERPIQRADRRRCVKTL